MTADNRVTQASAPTAPPADWEHILRSVMAEFVPADGINRIVDAAVERRTDFMNERIKAIDTANRLMFDQFNTATGRMQAVLDNLEETARQYTGHIEGLRAKQDADAKRISDMFKRVEAHDQELEAIRTSIDKLMGKQEQIHIDIHGSPTETNRKSIFMGLEQISSKVDSLGTSVNARLDKMEEKLDMHDAYITRRKAFETWAIKTVKGLWQKRLSRWAIISGMPLLVTLVASALDPHIAEVVGKLLNLLLTGK